MFSIHTSYKSFFKFVLPSVLSMLFISLYTIVDGIVVSRFVGTTALAAVNMTYPIYNLGFGVTIMLSVGGSALISIALGKKKTKEANNQFSLISLVIVVVNLVVAIIGLWQLDGILSILGVTEELFMQAKVYASILFVALPFLGVKVSFEYFLRVDNCANLSLFVTVIGGVINIILDILFVGYFKWGIAGAGYATLLGIVLPTFIGIHHFVRNSKLIKYVKPKWDVQFLKDASINGSSEMVTELSGAITSVVFNLALIKYAGAAGVAANSVMMYILFIFIAISIGITMGIQPAISYNYGADEPSIIRQILKKSYVVIGLMSILSFVVMQVFNQSLIELFLKDDPTTVMMAVKGMKIFAFAFLMNGFNIVSSGYFTAINNGKISAFISFSRSLVVRLPAVIILPMFLDLDGIWLAIPLAEVVTMMMSIHYLSKDKIIRKLDPLKRAA